jgi:putative copper resistance protein D
MNPETLAIAVRLCSFTVMSLIAGVPLFLALAWGTRGDGSLVSIRTPYIALAAFSAVLACLGPLISAAMMGGSPLIPIDWELVSVIVSETAVGKAMIVRLIASAALLLLALRPRLFRLTVMIPLSTTAAATLAWGGHAAASEGAIGMLHLGSDIVHILGASLWIGGMACLILSLREDRFEQAGPMLRVFAPVGSVIIALLLSTGILNSVVTIGFGNLPALASTAYGQLLAAKIALFLIMLGLAANNRFRLVPSFEITPIESIPSLRMAILLEIVCAALILWLVAWFGTLDPTGI